MILIDGVSSSRPSLVPFACEGSGSTSSGINWSSVTFNSGDGYPNASTNPLPEAPEAKGRVLFSVPDPVSRPSFAGHKTSSLSRLHPHYRPTPAPLITANFSTPLSVRFHRDPKRWSLFSVCCSVVCCCWIASLPSSAPARRGLAEILVTGISGLSPGGTGFKAGPAVIRTRGLPGTRRSLTNIRRKRNSRRHLHLVPSSPGNFWVYEPWIPFDAVIRPQEPWRRENRLMVKLLSTYIKRGEMCWNHSVAVRRPPVKLPFRSAISWRRLVV